MSNTRQTRQRAALSAVIADQSDFKSAQQLHALLAEQGVSIGLSTVYRQLASLCAAGEVDVQLRADGESVFRRCSPRHHHHLTCVECGRTVEVEAAEVEQWADAVGRTHGFSQVSHSVELTGRCGECSK